MASQHSWILNIYDRLILQRPWTVIFCGLVVVVILGVQISDFRLDASAETLVLEGDKDLRYARMINSRYGQRDFLVLTYRPRGDVFSEEGLARLTHLRDDLAELEHVSSVISILDVPLLESPPLSVKELTGDLPTLNSAKVDRELAKIEFQESPLYQNLLVSADLQTTALLIYMDTDAACDQLLERRDELRQKKACGLPAPGEGAELERVVRQLDERRDEMRRQRHQDIVSIRTIMNSYRAEAELFLGGVSMIADDMISFIKSDLKVFGVGVLIFMIVTMAIIFRRIRWILLPMLCCVVSTLCMMGLLGWLGWEVTVISSNFVSLQVIISLAITIHLIVRYRELLFSRGQEPNHDLILDTVRLKLRPCVYAVLTTMVGFGSLLLCDILPVIMFGWMMVIGLVVSLIVSFLIFPAMLMVMPKEKPSDGRERRFSLTAILAKLTHKHGGMIIGISGLGMALSLMGIVRLQTENRFIDYFKEDTEIHQGMKVIDQHLGGTTPLDIIVEFEGADTAVTASEPAADEGNEEFDDFEVFNEAATAEKYWFTAEKMKRVKAVQSYLDSLTETGKVLSLATMLSIVERLNDNQPLDSLELALLYNETPEQFKEMLVNPYVSVEHNQVRFWARVRDSEKSLKRNELLKKIKADLTGILQLDESHVHLTGLLVLYNNMLQSLFDSQILTLGITVAVLMGMFLVLFRSLKVALIAILPNVLAVASILGLMGWLGIPLDLMTITIAAIGIGISVDDTIHYIHRFKQEFEEDRSYVPTMHRCHGSIGHAMYYTSVTIIIGFSILALSNFIPSVRFGLLTGFAMLIALLANLTLLPQMLILGKPFGKEACNK